jgi:hypothetical protein
VAGAPPPLAVEEEVQPDVLHNDCRKSRQSRCGLHNSSRTDWMSSFVHPLTAAGNEISASTACRRDLSARNGRYRFPRILVHRHDDDVGDVVRHTLQLSLRILAVGDGPETGTRRVLVAPH